MAKKMNKKTNFINQLKELNGKTFEEVASEIGISYATVITYCNQLGIPTKDNCLHADKETIRGVQESLTSRYSFIVGKPGKKGRRVPEDDEKRKDSDLFNVDDTEEIIMTPFESWMCRIRGLNLYNDLTGEELQRYELRGQNKTRNENLGTIKGERVA
ncbi:hypothetical protein MUP56_02320 [Patescibacteria group bacterium]|nr:hypothetical protein [Patescibacteria group bacterium]